MDLKLVVEALQEYEKCKGLIPAIKAEYDSIVKMIDKAKELYETEKAAYEEVKSGKVSLIAELVKQKEMFLKEKNDGLAEVALMRANADSILNQAKLVKADLDTQKAALESAASAHAGQVEGFKAKLALLNETLKKIF